MLPSRHFCRRRNARWPLAAACAAGLALGLAIALVAEDAWPWLAALDAAGEWWMGRV